MLQQPELGVYPPDRMRGWVGIGNGRESGTMSSLLWEPAREVRLSTEEMTLGNRRKSRRERCGQPSLELGSIPGLERWLESGNGRQHTTLNSHVLCKGASLPVSSLIRAWYQQNGMCVAQGSSQ